MQWVFYVDLGWEDRRGMDMYGTVDDDDGCLNGIKFSSVCALDCTYLLLIKTKQITVSQYN